MAENNCGYDEEELAKSCRVALEKSFGMAIPVPEFSDKRIIRPFIVETRSSKWKITGVQ
jgi:hypothetical protein